jgi:hypothetical protein
VLARSPGKLLKFCFAIGTVAAAAATTWGLAIQVVLPRGAGELLLGPLWISASALLPPVIIAFALGGFEIAAAAGVRALGAARRSLAAQLVNAGLYVVLGVGGAWVDGARGSCWGVAGATTVGAVVWWVHLRRGVREHLIELGRSPGRPKESERIRT